MVADDAVPLDDSAKGEITTVGAAVRVIDTGMLSV